MDFDSLHELPEQLPKPKSNWAVFLDRDGVIWEERPSGTPFGDYPLYSGVTAGIKKLNEKGIYTVVVNNQARVARGEMRLEEAKISNQILEQKLKDQGSFIDLYLFCPHSEFADVPEYRLDCNWRKPGSGMLEFTAKKLGINLKGSYLIGDQARDFLAARNVGVTSIGVKTGKAGGDEVFKGDPDVWQSDLNAAVGWVLQRR